MRSAFRGPSNPVRKSLEAELPEYLPWFGRLRDQRNAVKEGVQFSIAGPDGDLGLQVVRFDPATGGVVVDCSGTAIRLGDVVTALVQSAAAADLGRRIVERVRH
jgi:hypothetical protein